MMTKNLLAGWLLVSLLPSLILAQQVATDPTSSHIFPAGGRRGSLVNVRVGGECLPPQTRFRLAGPGLKAPEVLGSRSPFRGELSPRRKPGEQHINYPKEWDTQVEIAADAPLGPRLWWLSCARGGAGGRPFIVGDLPEFIEAESNSTAERAEPLTLPMTLNGQISGERDLDYYSISAIQGEVIIANVVAARIGSPLETVLEFRDEAGRWLRPQEVRIGNDSVLALKVAATGKIVFSVANLSVAGGPNFVYRITLTNEPFARLAFPGGGQSGQLQGFELLTLTGEAGIRPLQQSITLPAVPGDFWWNPPGQSGALPLGVGTISELIEQEPNEKAGEANKVTLPITLNGRLATSADEDWFTFTAKAGQTVSVQCQSAGAGLPTLPLISIYDATGKELAKASAVDTPDRLPALEAWAPPADGDYLLCIRDMQQGVAGGPEFLYRAQVSIAKPDFELSLKNDWANHMPGGRSEIDVLVRRRGGFAGPVKVSVEGLPAGIRAEPLDIAAGAPSAKLVLLSEAVMVPPGDALLKINGASDINNVTVTHVATAPHLGQDVEGVSVGPATTEYFHLTVQHKPLFRLFCSEAYQYAHRGTIHLYQMEVERLEGYSGPITLQTADRQIKDLDGAEILETTIPAGESQLRLPIFLPETMHINVQAHSNIYAQGIATFQDKWGQKQSTCIVSEMRCMVRTLPTVTRLQALDRELTFAADETATCRLRLERTSLFSGPLQIALCQDESCRGIISEPVIIPAGQAEVLVHIRHKPGEKLAPKAMLRFRGTGNLVGGTIVVAEAVVQLR
ncbi:MAG: hypothetical protein ACR2FY_09415 [Pirellulaceae bacterium]